MSVIFWIIIYAALTGAITFLFCTMQIKIGVDPADGLMAPILCGVFWVIAGVPYAGYVMAVYINQHPEKAPWKKKRGKARIQKWTDYPEGDSSGLTEEE